MGTGINPSFPVCLHRHFAQNLNVTPLTAMNLSWSDGLIYLHMDAGEMFLLGF